MGSGLAVLWPSLRISDSISGARIQFMVAGAQEDEWAPAGEVGVVRSHFGAGAWDASAVV